MTKKYLKKVQILSAALLSSTFVLAEPKIIQSTGTVVNADPVKVVKVPAANEQALAELLFQFQQIQTEVAGLRGRVEELQFELDQLRAESKDRYIDLDRRLSGQPPINESGSLSRTDELDAVSAAENDPVIIEQKTASVDDIDPQIIEAEYNEAKDLIRQKDYVGSIKAYRPCQP